MSWLLSINHINIYLSIIPGERKQSNRTDKNATSTIEHIFKTFYPKGFSEVFVNSGLISVN